MHRGQRDDNYLFIIHQLNLFYAISYIILGEANARRRCIKNTRDFRMTE